MPTLWETVGYLTTSLALLNSLGFFFLKNLGTYFVEKNFPSDYRFKLLTTLADFLKISILKDRLLLAAKSILKT